MADNQVSCFQCVVDRLRGHQVNQSCDDSHDLRTDTPRKRKDAAIASAWPHIQTPFEAVDGVDDADVRTKATKKLWRDNTGGHAGKTARRAAADLARR